MVWFERNSALWLLFLLVVSVAFIESVSAFTIQTVTPNYVNRSVNTLMNFTINNTEAVNLTSITFTLPMEAVYYANSNGTGADNMSFSNSTSGPQITLTWTNISQATMLPPNTTLRSFWFNASIRNLGNTFFTNITVQAGRIGASPVQNSYNYVVYFAFSGFVKNETGGNQSGVNVTIYKFAEGQNGPPTETPEASILSDDNGTFSFVSVNGSASAYTLKMVYYNNSNATFFNVSEPAVKIGSVLPPFPANMYYPTTVDRPEFEFMRPPSLNGTTFYLQPAATLRLYANNNTLMQKFGYEVVDQVVGFPVVSNVMASVNTADVVVSLGRNYTVMFARFPGLGGSGFVFSTECNGNFMNSSTCPSPPISNSTLGNLVAGQVLVVNQSMNVGNYRLYGCINPASGTNNSGLNITNINLKMIPWPGFVPPSRADMGNIDLAVDINYSVSSAPYGINCSGKLAAYNISVMGAASGINYMVEMYAKNSTAGGSEDPGSVWNLASLQNLTITGNTYFNLTLYRLAGNYQASGALNSSLVKVNIQNSTGGAITNNLNANVKVKHPTFGTINYMIESMSSGTFYIPILNNSNWAKVMVFANDAPPKEITLNLSKPELNVTLVTMMDGRGIGMKRINETGGMEMINNSDLNSSRALNLRFLRNSDSCNNVNPDSGCQITSMEGKNFNPLKALVAGKINMEMKLTSTNVTLTFMNYDMFSAKQPPMESIMNDQAKSGAGGSDQAWEFGSFVPANTYEYVLISVPYNDSAINDSANMNISVPLLYDENWNVVWNSSKGDGTANLTDDFIDYNSSALYQNYMTSGGVYCNKTDTNLNVTPCFVNTTSNMVHMKIPHFSGVSPLVSGSAPATATASSSSSSSGGGGGGGSSTSSFWSSTYSNNVQELSAMGVLSQSLAKKERTSVKISGETHHVGIIDIVNNKVTINVSSDPQQATLGVSETARFELTNDSYYDLNITLINITNSSKADLKISAVHEPINLGSVANTDGTGGQQTDVDANQNNVSEEAGEKKKSGTALIILIVVAVMVVLIVAVKYFRRDKKINSKVKVSTASKSIKVN